MCNPDVGAVSPIHINWIREIFLHAIRVWHLTQYVNYVGSEWVRYSPVDLFLPQV